jgi:hypothetical protein
VTPRRITNGFIRHDFAMKDELRNRRDGVTIPTIWIAVALSVLLHVAVLWKYLPELKLHLPSPELAERGETSGSLVVQLAPPPRPPSSPQSAPAMRAQPAPAAPARPAPPPPRTSAPVLALRTPSTAAPPVRTPPPAPPAPAPAPAPAAPPAPPRTTADGDLASFIEARRRARGDTAAPPSSGIAMNSPPAEDDNARSNRIAAANLATQRRQTFGYDPSQGGGVFQLVRVGYSDAEFLFFGWNKDIRRNTKQLIEVRKGNNPDTRIAVVRRMIAIIREYEQQDFLWESQRLGRSLTLSARPKDNAGLEEFLMLEFFDDPLRPPPG